jgi:ATP-dependent Clp protease ATP-binding subunit ClpA
MVSHMLASTETAYANYEFITPAHLFSGLTKLEDALDPRLLNHIGLPPHAIPVFQAEAVQLLNLFKEVNLKPRQARHRIREILGDGGFQQEERSRISRTPESREVFERAGEIAQQAEASQPAVQHLLAALLERQDEHIQQVLAEFEIETDQLREKAAALPTPKVEVSPTLYLDEHGTDLVKLALALGLTGTLTIA